MIRIGLRDARSHFRRFAMSIIAIALGVAFVVGSFCFREMMNNQVSEMMATNSDHDVYVRGSDEVTDDDSSDGGSSDTGQSDSGATEYNTISIDLTDAISKVDGVEDASVTYSVSGVVLVDANGDAVATMGSPTMATGFSADHPWRSATFTSGTYPTADDEIALHSFAAEKSGLKVGDKAKVVYSDGPKDVTVTGIFATDATQAGAIVIGVTPSVAKHYSDLTNDEPDKTGRIGVYGSANGGKPLTDAQQTELADRINAALPADAHAHAITGDAYRDEATKSTQDALGFVQPLILIFAVIALFVGSFIIANTFSMIVRESMRGYALLRSIGASPMQVFSTVIVQAVLLGLVGSGLGIGLGWGMVELIVAVMAYMGTPLSGAIAPSATDMIAGLIVGLVVTLVGASLPARRAAFAPPIQAMNETVNPEKPVAPRGVAGAVLCVLGAATWLWTARIALADGDPTSIDALNRFAAWTGTGWPLGVGAGLLVIGVIMLGPALVGPAGVVLGWIPSHVFPVTGRLASRNLARSKRRTANTAAALFVGIAIVSCLGVVASSAKASVASIVDTGLKADFAVFSASSGQIPEGAEQAIRDVDGLKSVSANRFILGAKFDGERVQGMTFAAQDTLFTDVFAPEAKAGNADEALRGGQLVVGQTIAEDRGWNVGDKVRVTTENTVVDEDATAKAQADYQASIQAQIATLQTQLQRQTAARDIAGAQDTAAKIQQVTDDAKNVDPASFVKTKTVKVDKELTVGAIISNNVYRTCVIMNDELGDELGTKQTMFTTMMYLVAEPGQDVNDLQERLKDAVKSYYVVSVMNRDEYKSTMSSMVDQILLILYALLALSIVIAIFGIVNTLALSVSERTREIGLLRAIGTSRGQVRGMLGIEAAIISVFGTLLGLAVGVAAGVVIRAVYASQGLEVLSIPWDQIGAFLILSILVGLIASVSPASRALKQPVLDAVSSE
ncbi:ABC transporter permease [Bifidobacterium vespertilionis]|uniref:FtsX-like permease family protein n=1 Tax=Bifidobacterium vespertilionis TaxID=2562524 RepID=A0A5J5DUQ1_9BIFI|nr:ABC transporter permease [Bifidobacterium vespertilionis]KAA8820014.1 FtsX-like permease family protein [Bifidobacterium vespertilionis]KAA8823754.1 FtsX-like permease family protein [Bifidobacterium vespertilionis]